jgi:Zn-finger nucleic acid-binding protein
MPACPVCAGALDTVRQREGLYYLCAHCGGRALTIPQVRRVTGDRFAARLLRLIQLSRLESKHACPFCQKPMSIVNLPDPPIEVEGCGSCNAVWVDAPSYETLPEGLPESANAMSLLATEIFAERRLKEQKEREEREEAERKKSRKQRKTRDS